LDPVSSLVYTHQLDRDTLQLEDGPLKRIDLQLLAMVDHAREEELADIDRTFRKEIMLNGFSASGTFSDRFTLFHADRVLSVTAGGVNGMTLLPLEEAKGHTLRYHIGIADIESLTGESVDFDAVDATNQFLYFGAEDQNDTFPFPDAWTSDELRETAREVYGEDMHETASPTPSQPTNSKTSRLSSASMRELVIARHRTGISPNSTAAHSLGRTSVTSGQTSQVGQPDPL
jgi:hypothetical protein